MARTFKLPKMYLSTDRQAYIVNWVGRKDRRTVQMNVIGTADPWSCDNVRALTEFASVQARSGEVAAARAAIQKSGKSISELAQEQLDSLKD